MAARGIKKTLIREENGKEQAMDLKEGRACAREQKTGTQQAPTCPSSNARTGRTGRHSLHRGTRKSVDSSEEANILILHRSMKILLLHPPLTYVITAILTDISWEASQGTRPEYIWFQRKQQLRPEDGLFTEKLQEVLSDLGRTGQAMNPTLSPF